MVKLMGYLFNISAELDIDQWPSLDWVSYWAYLEISLLHIIQLLNQVTYSFIYNWTPATFTFAISGNLCARFWSRPIISLWLSYLGIKVFNNFISIKNIHVTHVLKSNGKVNLYSDNKFLQLNSILCYCWLWAFFWQNYFMDWESLQVWV